MDVVEVNEPLGFSTAERVAMLRRPWRAGTLVGRLCARWWTIARQGRAAAREGALDAVLVGYLGHFDVVLARLLFPRTRIVLDQLIFAADTARDRGSSNVALLAALGTLDRLAVACADTVVVDTEEHLQLLGRRGRAKALVVPVGAPGGWFAPPSRQPSGGGPLTAAFFGLYTPLQGATTIGAALALLADCPDIEVTMIGRGQDLEETRRLAGPNRCVEWTDWVEPGDLPALVAGHDVCLGIFGTTPKALRVVPNKVFQGAAAGCAILTSDTAPQRRALAGAAALVPPGDPAALADALRALARDRPEVARLQAAARRRADAQFAPAAVASGLLGALAADRLGPVMPPLPPLSPLASMRWAIAQRHLPLNAEQDILEIGCGQGALGARLTGRGHYLGLEPDQDSYAVARARIEPLGGQVRATRVDALEPDRRFDVVCAFEVLEHLEDDASAVQGWVERLRPGGTLIVTVPAWPARFGAWDRAVGHLRRYTPETLVALLEAAGLDGTSATVYGWPLADVLERGRNLLAGRTTGGSTTSSKTAASGRQLQPGRVSGPLIRLGITPFITLQDRHPDRGPALLAAGRRPDGPPPG